MRILFLIIATNLLFKFVSFGQATKYADSLEQAYTAEAGPERKYRIAGNLFNLFKLTNKKKSDFYFNELYRIADQIKAPAIWSEYYRTAATVADRDNNLEQSVEFARKAIENSLKIEGDDKNFQQKASYMLLANIYIRKEMLDKGLPVLLKADSVACDKSTLKPELFIAQIFSTLYLQQQNLPKALSSAQRTLSLAKTLNMEQQTLGAYVAIGQVYYFLEQFNRCLAYCDSARNLLDNAKRHYPYERQGMLGQMAQCYFKLGNYDSAKANYLRQLDLVKKINDTELIVQAQYHILECYLASQAPKDSVLKILQESVMPSGNVSHSIIETYLLTRYKTMKQINEPQMALHELELLNTFKDSIHNVESKKAVYDLEIKYETALKEKKISEQELSLNKAAITSLELKRDLQLAALKLGYEIRQNEARSIQERQRLQFEEEIKRSRIVGKAYREKAEILKGSLMKDKEISGQKLKLSHRRNTILAIGLLAAVFFMFGVLSVSRYYDKRKLALALEAKNSKIETLIQELHHRVKNNMQLISSLLSLQSGSLTDDAAKMAVMESRMRIEALGLIHQKLYLDDIVAEVNMKDYLSTLIEALLKGYVSNPQSVELTLNVADASLPVEIAIPIGLITNELVTNALKYGLTAEAPEIRVELVCSGTLRLVVADNGSRAQNQMTEPGGLGIKLVRVLAKQIGAQVAISYRGGTTVSVCQS